MMYPPQRRRKRSLRRIPSLTPPLRRKGRGWLRGGMFCRVSMKRR